MGKYDKYLQGPPSSQICSLCQHKLVKPKNGNTTGYIYHFKHKHPEVYEKINGKTTNKSEPNAKKPKMMQTLEESFTKWEDDGIKTLEIERSIVQMICVDQMPLMTPNKKGFKNFMKTIAPRFVLKERTHFSRVSLPLIYEEYLEKVKNELRNVPFVTLAIDIWCDKSMKKEVLGVTAHFLNSSRLPEHRALSSIDASKLSHTGVHISEMMKKAITEFELEGKVAAILRDGASNVKLAGSLLDLPSWDCWSHKLNLVAKAGTSTFSGLDEIIEKTKKVIRKVRKSSSTKIQFEKLLDENELPQKTLVKFVEVRWNTLHAMFSRFQELKTPIDLILAANPDWAKFTDSDWSLIAATLELLHPIVRSSQQSQSQFAISSSIIPTIRILMRELAKPATYAAPRAAMSEKLEKALKDYNECQYLKISMLIDPRYKFSYGDPGDKDILIKLLNENLAVAEDDVENCKKIESIDTNPFEEYLEELSQTEGVQVHKDIDDEITVLAEVERWSKTPPNPSVSCFEFWSSEVNKARFPMISTLVPKYLCSPPLVLQKQRECSVRPEPF